MQGPFRASYTAPHAPPSASAASSPPMPPPLLLLPAGAAPSGDNAEALWPPAVRGIPPPPAFATAKRMTSVDVRSDRSGVSLSVIDLEDKISANVWKYDGQRGQGCCFRRWLSLRLSRPITVHLYRRLSYVCGKISVDNQGRQFSLADERRNSNGGTGPALTAVCT